MVLPLISVLCTHFMLQFTVHTKVPIPHTLASSFPGFNLLPLISKWGKWTLLRPNWWEKCLLHSTALKLASKNFSLSGDSEKCTTLMISKISGCNFSVYQEIWHYFHVSSLYLSQNQASAKLVGPKLLFSSFE